MLQLSIVGFEIRLRSAVAAHPYPAKLVNALVAAVYSSTAQKRVAEAAMLSPTEALGTQPQRPAEPFLTAMVDQMRGNSPALQPNNITACTRARSGDVGAYLSYLPQA
jgi:hypothetical protein